MNVTYSFTSELDDTDELLTSSSEIFKELIKQQEKDKNEVIKNSIFTEVSVIVNLTECFNIGYQLAHKIAMSERRLKEW